ncbi:GNAT family N-acetyltransferase [Aquirhabdus sp.]|uniref:GNAT family N-acetyltransferase n=1 Tax=Aquirhabdus sp. TaxID=2824160 RepID=UPI00396C9D70
MHTLIELQVIPASDLTRSDHQAIRDLCTRAYAEDVWCDYDYLNSAYHVIGRDDGVIVSHALWVDRLLVVGQGTPLKTAYVEYVATEPTRQGQGLASQLLKFLIDYIQNDELQFIDPQVPASRYQLAALYPENTAFYARLGWELWQGALHIRQDRQLIATPNDAVMIHRLGTTPNLSIEDSLSAEWRIGELW